MKIGFNKELFQKNLYTFVTVCACIVFFLFLINIKVFLGFVSKTVSIISPFLIGFALAYLLNAPLNFFENTVFSFVGSREKGAKLRRTLAIVTTLLSAVIVLATLVSIIIPQLSQSVTTLFENTNMYIAQLEDYLYELANRFNIDKSHFEDFFNTWEGFTIDLVGIAKEFIPKILDYLPNLFDFSKQVTSGISTAFVGIVTSVYLLFGKEKFCAQSKKVGYALFNRSVMDRILEIMRFSHVTFSGYIVGKLLDSLIVGVLCFVGMSILKLPFALLISVIIGIMNIVPFFGPIVGAMIGALIVLMVDPIKMIWFVLFAVIIQQIDANIIEPRILGDSTGLPAFWVIFAIIVGGGFFGFVGMFIGAPLFAIIYSLVREFIEKRLKKKNLPTGTSDYYAADLAKTEKQTSQQTNE